MLLSHLLFLSLMCVTVNGLGEVRGTFTCRRNSEAGATTAATQAGTTTTKTDTLVTKAGTTIPATQAGTNTTKTGTLTTKAGATTAATQPGTTTTKTDTLVTKAGATIPATQAGTNTTKTGTLTTQAGATTAATQDRKITAETGIHTTKPGTTTTQAKITYNNDNGACSISSIVEGSLPNCHAIYEAGCHESGIYNITPSCWKRYPFKVYCNMTDHADENECHGGGWTVFQRRVNGSVDFNRNWASYKEGFGQLDHEFWLGNEKLHFLTKRPGMYRLRIDLVSSNGTTYHACYKDFRIRGEEGSYKLHVKKTAKDDSSLKDGLKEQNGKEFSTYDEDNTKSKKNCPSVGMGGWWYHKCDGDYTNLNGVYGSNHGSTIIYWKGLPNGESIISSEMKIQSCMCNCDDEDDVDDEYEAGATTTATQVGTTTTKTGTLTTKAGATTAATRDRNITTETGIHTTKPGATTTQANITPINNNGSCSISSIVEGSLPNCHAIYEAGCHESGIYNITPSCWRRDPFKVYCNMTEHADENECHGWTVFQRRVNGSVDFNRNWKSYKDGFGQLDHEFWLGNEKLHFLTKKPGMYRLRIDLVSRSGMSYHICYKEFRIDKEEHKYKLRRSSGSLCTESLKDGLKKQNDKKFSTYDMDNSKSCASMGRGGWWYDKCDDGDTNLNGVYGSNHDSTSIDWKDLPKGEIITYSEMKIQSCLCNCDDEDEG